MKKKLQSVPIFHVFMRFCEIFKGFHALEGCKRSTKDEFVDQ